MKPPVWFVFSSLLQRQPTERNGPQIQRDLAQMRSASATHPHTHTQTHTPANLTNEHTNRQTNRQKNQAHSTRTPVTMMSDSAGQHRSSRSVSSHVALNGANLSCDYGATARTQMSQKYNSVGMQTSLFCFSFFFKRVIGDWGNKGQILGTTKKNTLRLRWWRDNGWQPTGPARHQVCSLTRRPPAVQRRRAAGRATRRSSPRPEQIRIDTGVDCTIFSASTEINWRGTGSPWPGQKEPPEVT